MKRFQTLSSQFSSVNLLTVLILCALTFGIMGCDGGVGEVAVIDAAATDAAAAAATDVAADAAADAVTETAIAGSTDIALDLGGDIATVEPFNTVLESGDGAEDMAVGLSATNSDGATVSELDNKAGDLQMIAMTTRSVFHAEAAFLDVQNKRLILKAVENRGEAPVWGSITLGDKVISDLEQTKKLKFTGADGSPTTFEGVR